MEGHQLYAIIIGIALGLTRFQRGMSQKGIQWRHLLTFHLKGELTRRIDQLLQILNPVLPLAVTALFEMLDQA